MEDLYYILIEICAITISIAIVTTILTTTAMFISLLVTAALYALNFKLNPENTGYSLLEAEKLHFTIYRQTYEFGLPITGWCDYQIISSCFWYFMLSQEIRLKFKVKCILLCTRYYAPHIRIAFYEVLKVSSAIIVGIVYLAQSLLALSIPTIKKIPLSEVIWQLEDSYHELIRSQEERAEDTLKELLAI